MAKILKFLQYRYRRPSKDRAGLERVITRVASDLFSLIAIGVFIYQLSLALEDSFLATMVSLITASLFVYSYWVAETKYVVPRFSLDMNKYRKYWTVLVINRLLFFCLFVFLQTIFLVKWGLYDQNATEYDQVGSFVAYQQTFILLVILGFQYETVIQTKFSLIKDSGFLLCADVPNSGVLDFGAVFHRQ